MEITGTFPEGILVDGKFHTDFTLVEETMRTTLAISCDPAIDSELLDDEVYYSACLLAKRLSVAGLEKVTPEQVLDLSAPDSNALVKKTIELESRRRAFRDAAKAAAEGAGGPA